MEAIKLRKGFTKPPACGVGIQVQPVELFFRYRGDGGRGNAAVGDDLEGDIAPGSPDAPGLGIESLNEELIEKFRKVDCDEPWADTSEWDNEWSNDREWS